VAWRDGVHLVGTSIWCDARRRRDICFVSSADRVARADHGQLIATAPTLALLGATTGHLAVPLRRPFTLGTVRLELIASGRSRGSAALHVDLGDRSVLYAGAIRTRDCDEPADVRACDAVVVTAPVGLPDHVLPARSTVAANLVAWTREQVARRARPALVVETASDGLEVVATLAREGVWFVASRALRAAAAHLGEPIATRPPTGNVVVRTLAERKRDEEITALVSPRGLERPRGFAAWFAWPFCADRGELLAWIAATAARDVFVTGPCAEAICAAVGPRARVLGPPRQIELFPDL
jgi:hypothetical protein